MRVSLYIFILIQRLGFFRTWLCSFLCCCQILFNAELVEKLNKYWKRLSNLSSQVATAQCHIAKKLALWPKPSGDYVKFLGKTFHLSFISKIWSCHMAWINQSFTSNVGPPFAKKDVPLLDKDAFFSHNNYLLNILLSS